MTMTPLFIISLPRSGSTLLQKLLTTSPEIHSVSEPWLLLPLTMMLEKDGARTFYNHNTCVEAIDDFTKQLQNGRKDFNEALRQFVVQLYSQTQSGKKSRYFLDKTPRYYLIIPTLLEIFPDAKFIFLTRNPLDVLASILSTWRDNRLFLYSDHIDIYAGPPAISDGIKLLGDRAAVLSYEDLVRTPDIQLKNIFDHLELSYEAKTFEEYKKVPLSGRMGDPTGISQYQTISTDSLNKWKETFNTRYRLWFAKRYLRYLGDDVLRQFKTSIEEMNREIDSVTNYRPGSLTDLYYHLISSAGRYLDIRHYRKLTGCIVQGKRFYHQL